MTRIGAKPITFDLDLDPAIPVRFYGDELRVKQIVSNILSNAFKYTKEGSVTLQVFWEKWEDDGAVTFVVKDTGIGIREEDIGKLFLEYSQMDAKANRSIEGTGLGLAITKRLADVMEGSVTVESEYGRGSTFSVTIPQKIADEAPIGEKTAENLKRLRLSERKRVRGANSVRAHMPYGSILVVDDVRTNLDVAKGLLMPYGLEIHCAGSGQEAIEMISQGMCFDLILMDHMMPEMDGIEATRVIRNGIDTEYARSVPIVALTANAIKGSEEMFLENGFDAFISKPIDITHLDMALNKWVRGKRIAEVSTPGAPEHADKNRKPAGAPGAGQFLRHAEGIDFGAGVERYGSEDIYFGILASYARNTPALLHQLSGVSEGTLSGFAVTVHGLKGSSYGICADAVAKDAEALELAAKAGDFETVKAENGRFIRNAEKLLEGIEAMLEAPRGKDGGRAKKLSHSPDASLLKEMLDAVRSFNWRTMKAIAE
jgi:CheY-like chemotaxis protein/anti-sigma regulatory factor (Ser/Thr protein kinase)